MMHKKARALGTLEDSSPEQLQIVARLQADLKERFAQHPDLKTTWSLLRFCRARDFHYDRVKLMLENFMDFRDNIDYDHVKQLQMSQFDDLIANYARGYVGYDYEGRLVMTEKVSQSKPKNIVGIVSEETITNYFVNLYERLLYIIFPILSKIHNRRIDRTVLIIDLAEVNILKLFDSNLKAFLKFSSKMSQDYYPELLGKSFVLNAPWVFKGIWKIVKIWLDEKTSEKFVIESGNGKDKLTTCMDIRMLPKSLGGDYEGPLTDFTGPWKDDLLDSWRRKSFHLHDRTPEYQYFYTESERKAIESSIEEKQSEFVSSTRTTDPRLLWSMMDNSSAREVKISSFRVAKFGNEN